MFFYINSAYRPWWKQWKCILYPFNLQEFNYYFQQGEREKTKWFTQTQGCYVYHCTKLYASEWAWERTWISAALLVSLSLCMPHIQAINSTCAQNNKQHAVPTWSKTWLCWTSWENLHQCPTWLLPWILWGYSIFKVLFKGTQVSPDSCTSETDLVLDAMLL